MPMLSINSLNKEEKERGRKGGRGEWVARWVND
jgi:hypothetical protein